MEKDKNIMIVPYNKSWPLDYQLMSTKIKKALGRLLLESHHVGSTSVPNLASKPKIDIIAEVASGTSAIAPLEKIGFTYKGEWNIPFKYGFTHRGDISVNLHVFERSHPEIESNLLFRDYLRKNKNARDEYAELKQKLAHDPLAMQRHLFLYNYTIEKSNFIKDILKKAGFRRTRMTRCIDNAELETAKKYRQEYYSSKEINDPYIESFSQDNHRHFIFYQGVEILGYAHIILDENKGKIEMFELDNRNFESEFITLVKKWLKAHNYLFVL